MRYQTCLFIFAVGVLTGCGSKPEVNLDIIPRYPCAGEDVTFSYSLRNLDRIEVKNEQGVVLLNTSSASGSFVIKDIDDSMLPLTAKGWQGGRSRTKKIPGAVPFKIIYDEADTEDFELNDKILDHVDQEQIGETQCGCVYSGTEPVTCQYTAPISEVISIYSGQSANLPTVWFSERSRVVRIHNPSQFILSYERAGPPIATLSPGESEAISFSDDVRPGGTWAGKYDPNDYHEVWQGILTGKPCNGWHNPRLDVRRNVKMKFALRCNP